MDQRGDDDLLSANPLIDRFAWLAGRVAGKMEIHSLQHCQPARTCIIAEWSTISLELVITHFSLLLLLLLRLYLAG